MPDWPAKRRSRSAETPGRFFAQILGRLTQALLFSKVSSTFTIIGLRRRLCGCKPAVALPGRRIAVAERSTVRGLVGKDVLLSQCRANSTLSLSSTSKKSSARFQRSGLCCWPLLGHVAKVDSQPASAVYYMHVAHCVFRKHIRRSEGAESLAAAGPIMSQSRALRRAYVNPLVWHDGPAPVAVPLDHEVAISGARAADDHALKVRYATTDARVNLVSAHTHAKQKAFRQRRFRWSLVLHRTASLILRRRAKQAAGRSGHQMRENFVAFGIRDRTR